MKTLFFDCFAGASGNMILGGLVSLGVKPEALLSEIEKLNISDFDIEFTEVNRAGINSIHAKTNYDEEKSHRHLSDIERIIESSNLSDSTKRRSQQVFQSLAEAEARVHGIDVEKVHFHEVGAMDAIIDVVGACVGFELLGVEKFVCSKIHTGSGFVEIAHGKYPVPPPAVTELLKGIPMYSTEIEGELITPTGAAIISTLCEEFGVIPEIRLEKTGYGAGTREYDKFPNVLRLMMGESDSADTVSEYLILMETNIDDVSPEVLGFVMERAFYMGALDCWFTPIQMKKNRPATKLSVLCDESKKQILTELLYSETTTLGVRINRIERECLPRETKQIQTEFGEAEVKIARYKGKIVNAKPEYEWLKKIALEQDISIRELERIVLRKLEDK